MFPDGFDFRRRPRADGRPPCRLLLGQLLVAGLAMFQLLFTTSTRQRPTSPPTTPFRAFVQGRAKAGHSDVADSCGSLFKVVGCTSAADARINPIPRQRTRMQPSIYWLNGAKAADNYSDFYDGSWDSTAIRTESGATTSTSWTSKGEWAWTGNNRDGTNAIGLWFDFQNNVRLDNRLSGNNLLRYSTDGSMGNYSLYTFSPIFSPPLTRRSGRR
ncbi:MAG: hypothetical protein F4226_00110 [Synechococcus sp. SB0678_bin_12]|nr:hypothetical protein [Synechococcus sp. SB0678_bin_12]MYI88573.1 hypothetical protein [Synechococcus sp. SB0672_bin_10]